MTIDELLFILALIWTLIRLFKRRPSHFRYTFWDFLRAAWLPFLAEAIIEHLIK